MAALFGAQEVHREVLAAVLLFQEGARREEVLFATSRPRNLALSRDRLAVSRGQLAGKSIALAAKRAGLAASPARLTASWL
jgi:hypothetical protein